MEQKQKGELSTSPASCADLSMSPTSATSVSEDDTQDPITIVTTSSERKPGEYVLCIEQKTV